MSMPFWGCCSCLFVCVYLCGRFCQGGDGPALFEVQAHLAMLKGDFKLAEMFYLEQVGVPSSFLQPNINVVSVGRTTNTCLFTFKSLVCQHLCFAERG